MLLITLEWRAEMLPTPIAQSTPTASTIFYLTLLFIFISAIVTAILAKWARDKCLKFFKDYRVTLERLRGQTLWGELKVFSSGIEVTYDHAHVDPQGRKKTSYLFYQAELEQQVLTLFRVEQQLSEPQRLRRRKQIHQTFNPGFFRRNWRAVRNIVNTLRDAFNAAIGAAVAQYQRVNPASALLSTQAGAVTSIGQTLLGKFANAYEPLLEQYIGQPVILEVIDPINPNNEWHEYAGYLADYTQQYIAVFNVEHAVGEEIVLELPNAQQGETLPPLPPPPPPGAPAPILPPPAARSAGIVVRMDGLRMKIQNTRSELVGALRLEREDFEPLQIGMVLPPMGTLSLPARDARAGKLYFQVLQSADVIAPRRYATVRHAGVQLERRGLADEFQLDRLPLVSKLFSNDDGGKSR